jgi:hypothetical protein
MLLVDRFALLVKLEDVSEDGEADLHLGWRFPHGIPVTDPFQHRVADRTTGNPPGEPADCPGRAVTEM